MTVSLDNAASVIVALDFAERDAAMALVDQLDPTQCRLKVGKEMFTRLGPSFVSELVDRGHSVFLDLKFHDIPNTVAQACRAAADLGVWMVNVHASGGRTMMEAAKDALSDYENPPLLIAVTILTSLDTADLAEIGYPGDPADNVRRLAALTHSSGLDGVVCSPKEIAMLREDLGSDFQLVTPGIRPASAALGDQKRVMTPAEAVQVGASHLVIGRPITKAEDPLAALQAIRAEMSA